MAKLVLTLNSSETLANIKHRLAFGPKSNLKDYLANLGAAADMGHQLLIQAAAEDGVAGTKTVALSTCVAGDILRINGVEFTCVASGATGNQFNIGGSDTLSAVSLANAINGSSTALVFGQVKAAASTTNVVVTAQKVGVASNNISLECRGSGGLAITGSGVQASGTIAFSGAGAADDTVLINGVTFTAVAAGATGNQWVPGASATLSAAALAAAINASVTALVSDYVYASAATGTLTIKARRIGKFGNTFTIAEGVDGSNHMTVSGARLASGTDSAVMYLASGAEDSANSVPYKSF